MSRYYNETIIYPPGVKELNEDISTAELHRRLKVCREVLQTLNQEDDNSNYRQLALYLASDFFLQHRNRDIRLIVASCIADIFRIFAPDHPYTDAPLLKAIFMFFIDVLRGLASSNDTNIRGYFYLLENLNVVRTFNLYWEAEDSSAIVIRLFEEMFHVISVTDNSKMRRMILEVLVEIVNESESLPRKVVELILLQLISPNRVKSNKKWLFVQELIQRTASMMESYSRPIFNELLNVENSKDSSDSEDSPNEMFNNAYDLMFQFNILIPSAMVGFVNDLLPKLQCTVDETRLGVTRLLSAMFANESSKMIEQNKSLWISYLGRFNDVMPEIRKVCLEYSKSIYLYHPDSRPGITVWLKERILDHIDTVRITALKVTLDLAREDFYNFPIGFYEILTSRVMDKNYEAGEVTICGLVQVYLKRIESCGSFPICLRSFKKEESNIWNNLKGNILKRYYNDFLKNRQLVEETIGEYLIPHTAPVEQKVKLFYQMFCTIDDHAIRALIEMLKTKKNLRSHVKKLTEIVQYSIHDNRLKYSQKIARVICCYFSNSEKMHGIVTRFAVDLEDNIRLRNIVISFTNENITCALGVSKFKQIFEVLRQSDNHREPPEYLELLKKILNRLIPIFDKEATQLLISFVINSVVGDCSVEAELLLENTALRGLSMLKILSALYPDYFQEEKTYDFLLPLLQSNIESIAVTSLQTLCNIANQELHQTYKAVYERLVPTLVHLSEFGIPLQAKHSVLILNKIIPEHNRADFFIVLMRTLQNHFTLDSQYFKTALVSSGHIAQSWRQLFPNPEFKDMVTFIVSKVLMHDKAVPRSGSSKWDKYESLPDDTKVKIEGMKCIVRWLTGVEKFVKPAITTFRCFSTYLENGGDLTESKHISPMENSWLRLSAACRILKLCHVPVYAIELNTRQFLTLAYVLIDPCPQVRNIFAAKLHKALQYYKLPIEFLSMFAVGGLNEDDDFKNSLKFYVQLNIKKRRQRLNQTEKHTNEDVMTYLPDYAVPYSIHLLAHAPFFTDPTHHPTLWKIKECLQWFMDCFMDKEHYSCSFYKRLFECIKQTRDMVDPGSDKMNKKLYAVSDLGINIILSKKKGTLRDYPGDPVLNKRFFTDPDPSFNNMKTYLPREFLRKLGANLDVEFADICNDQSSTVNQQSSTFRLLKDEDNLRSDKEKTGVSSEGESVQSHLQMDNSDTGNSTENSTSSSGCRKNKTRRLGSIRKNGIISKHNLNKKQNGSISNSEIETFSDDEILNRSDSNESILDTWPNKSENGINAETGSSNKGHIETVDSKDNKQSKVNFPRKRGRPPVKYSKLKQATVILSPNKRSETTVSSEDEAMEDLSSEKELTVTKWLNRNNRARNIDANNVDHREILDKMISSKREGIARKRGRPPGKRCKVNKKVKISATASESEEVLSSYSEKNTSLFRNKQSTHRKRKDNTISYQTNKHKSICTRKYNSRSETSENEDDTKGKNFVRKRGRPPKIPSKNKWIAKTKLSVSRSTTSSDEENFSENSLNYSSIISVNISDSVSIKHLIKECNVTLKTNEIEQYTRKFPLYKNTFGTIKQNQESSHSTNVENASSFKVNHHLYTRAGKKTRKVEPNNPVLNKRNKKSVNINNAKNSPKPVEMIERHSSGKNMKLRNKTLNEKSKPNRR